ncbi:MAG: anaerobic ribonucleoside-triphosphate reductase, partial [Oscillospiraceae bacterium]
HKLINLKNQYSTIGIIGVYESLKYFGMTFTDKFGNTAYTNEGVEFMEDILAMVTDVKNNFTKDKDYNANIEQVPAERCAAILQQKDFLFYPDEVVEDLPLYGNQWIPLGIKSTLYEKISLSAILDKACSGGSIAHINLDAPLDNFEKAWGLLNFIASEGVTYFAFNVRISACEHNHGFFGNICPYCGGKVNTTWQRIVGFLTPVSSYSKDRKNEFNTRYWLSRGELD